MLAFEEHPTDRDTCPKCTVPPFVNEWIVRFHEQADQTANYSSWPTTPDPHLCWSCSKCGYAIRTKTADAHP